MGVKNSCLRSIDGFDRRQLAFAIRRLGKMIDRKHAAPRLEILFRVTKICRDLLVIILSADGQTSRCDHSL